MTLLPEGLLLVLLLCAAGGFVIGLGYFRALRGTADLVTQGGRPLLGLALTLGRFAAMAAGLLLAVQFGGAALLAALAGILGARELALRRIGRDRA